MRMNWLRLLAITILVTAGAGRAAAQGQPAAPAPPPSQFKVTSSAYSDGGQIPTQFSCAVPTGASPAFQWSNPPAGTMSFAVVFHDLEGAPAKGSMDVTHWIFWNVAPTATSIPASVQPDTSPEGMVQGKNVRNVNGYQPPCPPPGATPHHYVLELFALDSKLDLPAGSARADLLKAIDGHVIGKAAYYGIFGR
jgi:Raf kinase inhibitor-like YbhB/YbcL family protein